MTSLDGVEGLEVYANVSPSVLATEAPATQGTVVYDAKLYSALNYLYVSPSSASSPLRLACLCFRLRADIQEKCSQLVCIVLTA